MKNLVIVESPAKVKSVGKYLGPDYKVMSSYGHIRDLKTRSFSIDTKTLMPEYVIPADKQSLVKSLRSEAKKADKVWLASDEDREGEAIAWHLAEVLGLDVDTTNRIVFHEITQPALLKAIATPRHIDRNLVNAQQARRVFDRIVGFELSPVLWRKIKPGLSAGRVQSVVVRLVVEREREIENFVPKTAYVVSALFDKDGTIVKADLNKRFDTAEEAKAFLEKCRNAVFTVENLEKKPTKRSPAPPFMTSTLQQEASRKLGYSVSQTMRIAQGLYEKGFITYMRTDSLNLSTLCLGAAKQMVLKQYGEQYYKARNFHTKAKGAQEAHEAIRPTQMDQLEIEGTQQEKRLYRLILLRTLASQMADAKFEKTVVTIGAEGLDEKFVAEGEVMTFNGYTCVYHESADEESKDSEQRLPKFKKGEAVTSSKISATQRFSQRPARFSEGSLVKKMEELGIGRPSTYSSTISTIQQRGYVEKGNREGTKRAYTYMELTRTGVDTVQKEETTGAEKGKLFPTDTGKIVNDYLVECFPSILDLDFTARVEKDFDTVAAGKKDWNKLTKQFYKNLTPMVAQATEQQTELRVGERQLGTDPKTGRMVSVKIGRYGPVAQLGLSTDNEKPQFAQLRDGQSLDTITLEEALDLFKLPRVLGHLENGDVVANISRFGPYVGYNKQYVTIPKEFDVMTITLDEARQLLEQKAEAEKKRVIHSFDGGIEVLNGRYGPYITFEGRNYRLPKELAADPNAITAEQCREVIEKAPKTAPRKKRTKKS